MEGIIVCTIVIVCIVAGSVIMREQNERKKTEKELETIKNTLKEVCEETIKNNNNIHAKIIYEVYCGKPVDHTGDGFIDGYEWRFYS